MAIGRTHSKWLRFYMSGYELGTNARSLGTALWSYEESELSAWQDTAKGYLPNHAVIGLGPFNGIFDNTATTGLHVIASAAPNTVRDIMVPVGERAIPALGDPTFMARLLQLGYTASTSGDVVNIPFGSWDVNDLMTPFGQPWGHLHLAKAAKTAANTSNTDNVDSYSGAATSEGGYFMYQVFAANAAGVTATISVQDSVDQDNGNFAEIAGGCTTGVIDVGTAPVSGIIRTTDASAAVKRYTRWQLALGTATSVTFALAFVRGRAS